MTERKYEGKKKKRTGQENLFVKVHFSLTNEAKEKVLC
jgi:hypothetical protein